MSFEHPIHRPFMSIGKTEGMVHQRSRRSVMALLTSLAVATAVTTAALPAPGATAATSRSKATTKVSTRTPFVAPSAEYGLTLTKFAADLDAFWAVELPKNYRIPYRPLRGYFAYDSVTNPPDCGSRMRYPDVAGNAFYCRAADYIAFDNEQLFPDLYAGFGDISLGMVLAHEMGHAVQTRTKTRLPSVYAELQADCFAGAWLRHVADGRSKFVKLDSGVIEDALSATLAFRDRPGIGAGEAGAHGNGFDRTGAVQIGYDEGAGRCATFRTNPPPVTATSFQAASDAASGGDVSLDEAVRLTIASANRHFASVPGFVPITVVQRTDRATVAALSRECANSSAVLEQRVAVCPDIGSGQPLVRVSENALNDASTKVGDVGASMILVLGWTTRVQQLLGEPTRDSSVKAELRATCLAGTWLGAAQRGESGTPEDSISLSPGDVDEALITVIRTGGSATIFDRVRALRVGFQATTPSAGCARY